MTKESLRKLRPIMTSEALLSGKFPNPFTPMETELLGHLINGFDGLHKNSEQIGISREALTRFRSNIKVKVNDLRADEGRDFMAKALSIAVLGEWVDTSAINSLDASLSGIEYHVLFLRCFGNTSSQIRHELKMLDALSCEVIISGIKKKLGVNGDYQMIAWGAFKAKEWFKNNPGAASHYLSDRL